jgi:hypothetical protein
MKEQYLDGLLTMEEDCTGILERLQSHFPGLAAFVNFFDVAADRRTDSNHFLSLRKSAP